MIFYIIYSIKKDTKRSQFPLAFSLFSIYTFPKLVLLWF